MQKYKLCLITASLKSGGAERVMSELANFWAEQGHEIHLVILSSHPDFYKISDKIIVHRLGFKNINKIQRLFSEFTTLFRLRKLLKKENPDSVLVFQTKYNVLTILAALLTKIPVFVSDRNNPKLKAPFFLRLMRKIFYPLATGIVAQTGEAKNFLVSAVKCKNVAVIPNPIKKMNLSETNKEKIILNIGRLVWEKGQKHLINAFAKINDSDWELVILGDGPLMNDLQKQVTTLNLQDRVILNGTTLDVDSWLSKASVFAFSSVSEGFPNALAESMCAGLPCVSFDCDSGPRDLIKNNKNGFLIPVGDENLFTEKLQELINNADLRNMFVYEAKKLNEELKIEVIAEKYLDFITQNQNEDKK